MKTRLPFPNSTTNAHKSWCVQTSIKHWYRSSSFLPLWHSRYPLQPNMSISDATIFSLFHVFIQAWLDPISDSYSFQNWKCFGQNKAVKICRRIDNYLQSTTHNQFLFSPRSKQCLRNLFVGPIRIPRSNAGIKAIEFSFPSTLQQSSSA